MLFITHANSAETKATFNIVRNKSHTHFRVPLDHADADWVILSFKVTQEFWLSEHPAGVDQYQLLCWDSHALC